MNYFVVSIHTLQHADPVCVGVFIRNMSRPKNSCEYFTSLNHMYLSISVNFKQCCVMMSFVIKKLFAKYAVQFVCMRRYEYDSVGYNWRVGHLGFICKGMCTCALECIVF